ncbi:MAG: sulfotransferase domain-containing protein, partial [Pyrinomonadaceae bacterium]
VFAALQNEQELDLPQFVKFGTANTVTQQHARASEPNIQIMQAFGVRPTILVRNIFDTTVSLLDFYTKGFVFSTYFDKAEFLSFDEEQKIDLLIEFVLPWYFQFVASWQRAEQEKRLEMNWVTYEEMIADKAATVARILAFYGIKVPADSIEQKIASVESKKEQNRMNKGIAGRGMTVLSDSHRKRIGKLARHFPSADFSIIGL